MPKKKTHKGAAKRFRITKNGKVMHKKQGSSHILTKKSPKRKRSLRQITVLSKADSKVIKKMLV